MRPIWTLLYTLPHPTFFLGRRHLSLSPLVRPGVRRLAPPNTQDSPFPCPKFFGLPTFHSYPSQRRFSTIRGISRGKGKHCKENNKSVCMFPCWWFGGGQVDLSKPPLHRQPSPRPVSLVTLTTSKQEYATRPPCPHLPAPHGQWAQLPQASPGSRQTGGRKRSFSLEALHLVPSADLIRTCRAESGGSYSGPSPGLEHCAQGCSLLPGPSASPLEALCCVSPREGIGDCGLRVFVQRLRLRARPPQCWFSQWFSVSELQAVQQAWREASPVSASRVLGTELHGQLGTGQRCEGAGRGRRLLALHQAFLFPRKSLEMCLHLQLLVYTHSCCSEGHVGSLWGCWA